MSLECQIRLSHIRNVPSDFPLLINVDIIYLSKHSLKFILTFSNDKFLCIYSYALDKVKTTFIYSNTNLYR